MAIVIRKATEADLPHIHRLVYDLAVYEKSEQEMHSTVDLYRKDFNAGKFDAVVAVDTETDRIVGMGLYYLAYSTWKGQYLWLEDFVVEDAMRGKGVGKMVFEAIKSIANETNSFFKLQVLDWNTPAIEFYEKNNGKLEKEWITCRV